MICTAVMTQPYPLLLSNGLDYKGCRECCYRCRHNTGRYICRDIPDAFALIAQELLKEEQSVSGVLAKTELAAVFASIWKLIKQRNFHLEKNMRVYELQKVRTTTSCKGSLRPAGETDMNLIYRWGKAFHNDVGMKVSDKEFETIICKGIENRSFYLWDDDGPVSMARHTRPTPNGITVNFVYTPPEFRRKGYATACVSELSRRMLDTGYKFCTLFADKDNLTANSIYQRIGYRSLADFSEYKSEESSLK